MPWVLVDVGCIECGEDTYVVGVYETEGEAIAAFHASVTELGETTRSEYAHSYFAGGQRELRVLQPVDEIDSQAGNVTNNEEVA